MESLNTLCFNTNTGFSVDALNTKQFMTAYEFLFVNDSNNTLSIFLDSSIARKQTFDEFITDAQLYSGKSFMHTMESFIENNKTYLLIKVDRTVCVICLETLTHCTLQAISSTRYKIVKERYATLYRSYPQDYYTNYDERKSLCHIPNVIHGMSDRYNIYQVYLDSRNAAYSITDRDNKNVFIAVDFLEGYSVKITKMVLTTAMSSNESDISCPSADLEIS